MATIKELRAGLTECGVEFSPKATKAELEELFRTAGAEELYEPCFGAFVQHKTDGTYGRFWGSGPGRSALYTVFGTDDAPDNGFVSGREEREVKLRALKPADEHHMALMHMRQTIVETWFKDRAAQHKASESAPPWAIDALV